jgi:hypothetical protein
MSKWFVLTGKAGGGHSILIKRGTAEDAAKYNPILAKDELAFEKPAVEGERGALKRGDGVTRWNDLPYLAPMGCGPVSFNAIDIIIDAYERLRESENITGWEW